MNNFSVVGRLTKPVEPKYFDDGKIVAKFSIAINRGKGKDDVDYFECEVWGKSAETLINYTDKGSQVGLEGRLKQDRWTTQDGANRSAVKLIAEKVTLLGGKNDKPAGDEPNFDDQPF